MMNNIITSITAAWLTPHFYGRLVSHFSFDTHGTQEVKAEHPLLLNRPFCRRWTCLSPPLPIVVTLGLACEALFYQNWEQLLTARECASCELGDVLLHMYNASGNMEMGEKMIPDGRLAVKGIWWLSSAWIHNPNEWAKDHSIMNSLPLQAGAKEATILALLVVAKLHAPFWHCTHLTERHWLRGANWMKGENRDEWEKAQHQTAIQWERRQRLVERRSTKIDGIHCWLHASMWQSRRQIGTPIR